MKQKNIHFIGIGGVGMAALAALLKWRGSAVSGCDLKPTARTRWLESLGIAVATGHDAAHLAGEVNEVIVTPAVARDNPERVAAERDRRVVVRLRGEVLAELVNSSPDTIAVCGSHGKTTTATFIAKLLGALGEDVAWAIGGETGAFPVAGRGDGPLVVEADESDGTLALYRAGLLVVNRCEYDHPDHFRTEADYHACFAAARRAAKAVVDAEALPLDGWSIPVAGAHNVRNARAAIEVALRRGHSPEAIAAALPQAVAELPDRRFERLAEGVYTDYAHHPTEMKCAVLMARAAARGKLRVLFQPHRPSRTRALLADFPAAFEAADEVVFCPTYAAFERPVEGGDVADLYRECRSRLPARIRLYLARSCAEAWTHARLGWKPGDVTLLLGAGDIIALRPMVEAGETLPGARHWIGMGSNTWRSDLENRDEYVRTEGPAGRSGAELGIPWMVGIPGTVGGWLKMNAGAFGHSIGELVSRVKVDGRWLTREECGFAYRHSDLEGEIQDFVLLPVVGAEGIESYRARRRKFPAGTWGSVFKNPPGDFAGRVLEAAGAKGLRVGGACVWEEHANVIVAGADATASDVLALARLMRARVFHRFGLELEPEVRGLEF